MDSIIPEGIAYLKKAQNEVYPPHSIYRFAGNGAYWQKDYVNAIKYYELYLQPSYTREEGTSYEEITNQLSVCYIFSNQPDKAKNILLNLLKSDEPRLKKENSALYIHPTQKPVRLLEKMVLNSSLIGDTVLDPFT